MELEHLRDFVMLAETRSFARTAEQLFTTQSTISKHIKSLENELGTPLFTRTSRHVELNDFGRLFLPYAEKILQIQYEYTTAFYNQMENKKSTLSIGSIPVMAQYRITDVIVQFKNENKNFKLNVIEAETEELKEHLRENRCEIAFVRESERPEEDFVSIPYYTDTLVALLPISHPLADRKSLALKELCQEDFVLLKEKTFLYDLCLTACQNAGFTPNVVFTGHRLENILDFVAKGLGISLLMERQTMHYEPNQVSVIPIAPPITSRIQLIYQKNRKLSAAAKHFVDCVLHGQE